MRSTYRHIVGTWYSRMLSDPFWFRMDRRIRVLVRVPGAVHTLHINTLKYYDMFMPIPVRFSAHMHRFRRAVCAKRTA